MSNRSLIALLACLWIVTIAAAYYLGQRHETPDSVSPQLQTSSESLPPVALGAEDDPSRADTDAEVADLLGRIDRLQETLDRRNKALMRLVLNRILDSNAPRPEMSMSVADLIERIGGTTPSIFGSGIADLKLIENTYYDQGDTAIVDYVLVMVELARRKEQAVPMLVDLIRENTPPFDELPPEESERIKEQREFVFEYLKNIHDVRAFEGLLEHNELLPERELPNIHNLAGHVANLPSDEILPYAPRIMRLLREAIDPKSSASSAITIAGSLVFSHNYAPANAILMDRRSLRAGLGNALTQANEAHTPQARQYVEWIAGNHQDEGTRDHAEQRLAEW